MKMRDKEGGVYNAKDGGGKVSKDARKVGAGGRIKEKHRNGDERNGEEGARREKRSSLKREGGEKG